MQELDMSQKDWDWTHKSTVSEDASSDGPERWRSSKQRYVSVLPSTVQAQATIVEYLTSLYGANKGWCEINVNAKPGATKPRPVRDGWLLYSPNTVWQIAARCVELSRVYGDVYVSRALYNKNAVRWNKRDAKYALPTRICVVDDPEACLLPHAYALIETSPGNYQALFKVIDIDDNEENVAIATQLAQYGDASGSDITQLVRVPATLNTKRGQNFVVAWHGSSHQRYTAPALAHELAYTPVASEIQRAAPQPITTQGNVALALPHDEIHALWQEGKRDRHQHFDGDGIPHCVRQRAENSLILIYRQQPATVPRSADGSQDTSRRRFHEATDMKINQAPESAIAYYLIESTSWDSGKSAAWLERDAARILAKLRVKFATRAVEDSPPEGNDSPAAAPCKRNRVSAQDVLKAVAGQLVGGVAFLTQQDLASKCGCSTDTIMRREKELTEQGLVERSLHAKRQSSLLRILPDGIQALATLLPNLASLFAQTRMCLTNDILAGTSNRRTKGRSVPTQRQPRTSCGVHKHSGGSRLPLAGVCSAPVPPVEPYFLAGSRPIRRGPTAPAASLLVSVAGAARIQLAGRATELYQRGIGRFFRIYQRGVLECVFFAATEVVRVRDHVAGGVLSSASIVLTRPMPCQRHRRRLCYQSSGIVGGVRRGGSQTRGEDINAA